MMTALPNARWRLRVAPCEVFDMVTCKWLLVVLAVALPVLAGAGSWTATLTRVGPLKIGMSLAAVNATLGTHLAAPAFPTQDPSNECFYVEPPRVPAVQLMIFDGRLVRVDVVRSGLPTSKGVAVGDPQARIIAAYGSRAKIEPAFYDRKYGRYLTVMSSNRKYGLRFVTLHGKIQEYYVGTEAAVQWVEGCA